MKCLTESECKIWLNQHGVKQNPYYLTHTDTQIHRYTDTQNVWAFQFSSPQGMCVNFVQELFKNTSKNFYGALIVLKDWLFHVDSPDQLASISMVRRSCGEIRDIMQAPGHLLEQTEFGEAIFLCSLINFYGWSAYIYLASGDVTFFLWEGTLIDSWTKDQNKAEEIMAFAKKSGLKISNYWC